MEPEIDNHKARTDGAAERERSWCPLSGVGSDEVLGHPAAESAGASWHGNLNESGDDDIEENGLGELESGMVKDEWEDRGGKDRGENGGRVVGLRRGFVEVRGVPAGTRPSDAVCLRVQAGKGGLFQGRAECVVEPESSRRRAGNIRWPWKRGVPCRRQRGPASTREGFPRGPAWWYGFRGLHSGLPAGQGDPRAETDLFVGR